MDYYRIDGITQSEAIEFFMHYIVNGSDNSISEQEMLQVIGEVYQADRAYLFELDYDNEQVNNTYEWCAEGVNAEIDNLQGIPFSVGKSWFLLFESEGHCSVLVDDRYAKEHPEIYKILEPQGIESVLVVPLYVSGELMGFVGVDNPRANTEYRALLSTMASAFYMKIMRIRECQYHRQFVELKEKIMELEYINLVSQIKPHFIFNTLASIREIVLDDPDIGAQLLMDFTVYLRACIRLLSSQELISFEQELENVKAYVNIEKVRLGDKVNIRFDISDTDFMIEPLSLQPLVENAFKHGFKQNKGAIGELTIKTFKSEQNHVIKVIDNGCGFDCDRVISELETGEIDSHGLINVINRLSKNLNAKVDISSEIGIGTEITIFFSE